jgi:hypothetical protein
LSDLLPLEQGCLELAKPERMLPLIGIVASDLNRTVCNYAASTLLNVTAVEEARTSLGKDATVLLGLLDAINKLQTSTAIDMLEKLLAALLRFSECDAIKLTLVRATGALATVTSLLSTPVTNVVALLLGFLAQCTTHCACSLFSLVFVCRVATWLFFSFIHRGGLSPFSQCACAQKSPTRLRWTPSSGC